MQLTWAITIRIPIGITLSTLISGGFRVNQPMNTAVAVDYVECAHFMQAVLSAKPQSCFSTPLLCGVPDLFSVTAILSLEKCLRNSNTRI